METDSLLALIRSAYRPEEYPALHDQIDRWQKERPLAGLRILDATPIFRNTLVKYRALQASGALLSVGLSDAIACDPAIVDCIRANGIPVVRPSDPERQAFDLILDCAGAFAGWNPVYGFVELTRSGVPRYAHSSKPVYVADSGRIKRIETMLGTGESYFRTMAQLGYAKWKDRRLVVFGSGKVGSGIVLYAHRHDARISIVTEPQTLSAAIRKLADEVIDCRDASAVGHAVRGAYAVVTATGHKGAFQECCPEEAWRPRDPARAGAERKKDPEFHPRGAHAPEIHRRHPGPAQRRGPLPGDPSRSPGVAGARTRDGEQAAASQHPRRGGRRGDRPAARAHAGASVARCAAVRPVVAPVPQPVLPQTAGP